MNTEEKTGTEWTTCEVQTRSGPVAVVAEPTDTPGLVVTPAIGEGGGLSGAWALTHAASGYQIPLGWADDTDIEVARRTATALGTTPVDWTADRDAVVAQIAEHKAVVMAARRDAEFPPPIPDPEDGELGEGAAPYPRTEAQATADAVARHLTRGLQFRCRDTWDLIKRKDDDGRAIYDAHSAAKCAEWALVSVLRAFAKVDQRAADCAAREIWLGWEAGDAVHEDAFTWAGEYRLPQVTDEAEAVAK